MLEPGDVIYVEPLDKDAEHATACARLPEISGAIVVMDPWTGRVLAMVGGFSFDQSQFNRATQALRQPGSSFKPFVYAAALDNGYTPSTVVMDAPIEIDQGAGQRRVAAGKLFAASIYGPQTLRFGIEHSRNVMTVRLAQDVGMPLIAEYAKRFGVYDDLPPYLSFALGAGETTVLRMVDGLFDVRQRRQAHQADPDRPHPGSLRPHHLQARPARMPRLRRRQVGEPAGAGAGRPARAGDRSDDRLPDHLDDGRRGAARHRARWCARSASRSPARPAPPTTKRTSGSSASRPTSRSASISATTSRATSAAARPAAASPRRSCSEFLKVALADKPAVPFRVPAGIKLIRIDAEDRHARRGPGAEQVILEAFKPGTAPPDSYSVIGYQEGAENRSWGAPSPDADNALRTGRGGLW